jgi:hypothetical protein
LSALFSDITSLIFADRAAASYPIARDRHL